MAISKIPGAGVSADTLEAGDIAANAIGASELADNAVDTAAIAATSITEAKLNADVTDGSAIQTSVKPHIQPGTLYPAWNALLEDNTGHTFTDSSASGHLVRGYGGVNHSGLQKKVGSTSLKFPALTTQRILIDDHADWDFGTGAFTIECWARLNTLGVQQGIMELGGDGNDGWRIFSWHNSNGFISVRDHDDSNDYTITATGGTGVLTVNTWHHLCVTRAASGGAITLYIDGVSKGTATQASAMNNASGSLAIGLQYDNSGSPAEYLNGYLDEIRIVNGTQVYTGNFTPPTALTTSGGTYSDTTNVNTSFTASHTKLLIHSEAGGHSGAYGTAQSDGKKYYYTDIKGSKPIKDPRIGAHFGATRHRTSSVQLQEQETATHEKDVYSVDGRDWIRIVGDNGSANYNTGGTSASCWDTDNFWEITFYGNQLLIQQDSHNANRGWTVTVDGGDASAERSPTQGTKDGGVLGGRYVNSGCLGNTEMSETLGIHTVKLTPHAASDECTFNAIETIVQDTTSTATKSKIQIPAQNVVSYGKKFSVSAAAQHYNPFDGMSGAKTLSELGTYIDTATSLGMDNWKGGTSNYYKPFNGGRVVKWVDSSGTIKTSVTMMPPNAQNISRTASNAVTNTEIQNSTNGETINFNTSPINDSLSEVAKTFFAREFGNGNANGGSSGSWKDISMLGSTGDPAYVMDDGLTSIAGNDLEVWGSKNTTLAMEATSGDYLHTTFIGTGVSVISDSQSVRGTIALNLPYGTHILKQVRTGNNHPDLTLNGVSITKSGFDTKGSFSEITFHQPKKPPVPDDACILADYMLMADFVAQTSATVGVISKGTRTISCSRDFMHTGSANHGMGFNFDYTSGFAAYDTAESGGTWKLPTFSTNFVLKGVATGTRNKLYLDGVDKDSASTINNDAGNGAYSYITTSYELGLHLTEHRRDGSNGNWSEYNVVTPIHTSSHYQTFETPFLHELVGGDRNMEQTNLVVTPDGKTWDEVTRDTSYLGHSVCMLVSRDGGTITSDFIFDYFRGNGQKKDHYTKGIAIAYDRFIILEDGTYKFIYHNYNHGADTSTFIILNSTTGSVAHGMILRNDPGDHTVHGSRTLHLKRGDYIKVKVTSGTADGTQVGYNDFQIIKIGS